MGTVRSTKKHWGCRRSTAWRAERSRCLHWHGLRSHVDTSLSVAGDEVGSTVDVDEAVPPWDRGRGNASPRGILAQKIRELAELAGEDLITEEEFTQGKDELLASLQPY